MCWAVNIFYIRHDQSSARGPNVAPVQISTRLQVAVLKSIICGSQHFLSSGIPWLWLVKLRNRPLTFRALRVKWEEQLLFLLHNLNSAILFFLCLQIWIHSKFVKNVNRYNSVQSEGMIRIFITFFIYI